MNDDPQPIVEPNNLRFLRVLITVLTGTMIVGLLTIIGLFVMRFSATGTPPLPETVTLPAGQTARAVTYGPGWYAIVTDSDEILIYGRDSGTLRQRVQINTASD